MNVGEKIPSALELGPRLREHSEDMLVKHPIPSIALTLVILLSGISRGAHVQPAADSNAEEGPVVCRVMEAFEDGRLGAQAIIFHQRDKADGPRLGSFLLAHSGTEVELETTLGQRYRITVFRVRSAFGRGLALVPTRQLKLGAHDEFTLRVVTED